MAWKFFTNTGELKVNDGTTTVSGWHSETFTSQTEIVVTHNLGSYPVVQVFDASDVEADAQITQDSTDQCTVNLSSSMSGRIVCVSGVGRGNSNDAIHDNVAGEILAVAEDTAPIGTHEILAETAAGTKQSIKLSNLGTAGATMKTTAASTIYVDTGGNDSNPGTSGSPKLTVQGAIDHLLNTSPYIAHACVIAVGSGTFQLTSTLSLAGLTIPGSLTIKGMDTSDNDLFTQGTAGAGAATTITLAAGTSWATNFWAGAEVWIHAGTGLGQRRTVISSTNADPCVLTISSGATNWGTNPDNTSVYVVSGLAKIQDNNALNNAIEAYGKSNVTVHGLWFDAFESYAIYEEMCSSADLRMCLATTATGRGFYLGNSGGFRVYYNYFDVSTYGFVSFYNAGGLVYYNVFERNGAAGTGTGNLIGYGSTIAMSATTANKNIFIDWATGINATTAGFVGTGSSQVFTNCTADTAIGGTQATDPAYIT